MKFQRFTAPSGWKNNWLCGKDFIPLDDWKNKSSIFFYEESVYGSKPAGSLKSGGTSAHSQQSNQSKSRGGETNHEDGEINGNGNPFETIDDD